jgi:hypothetical protein
VNNDPTLQFGCMSVQVAVRTAMARVKHTGLASLQDTLASCTLTIMKWHKKEWGDRRVLQVSDLKLKNEYDVGWFIDMIESHSGDLDGIFIQYTKQLQQNEPSVLRKGFHRSSGMAIAWVKWLRDATEGVKEVNTKPQDERDGINDVIKFSIESLKNTPRNTTSVMHGSFTCKISVNDVKTLDRSLSLLVYGVKFTCKQITAVADALVRAVEENTTLPCVAYDFVHQGNLQLILERRGYVLISEDYQTWMKHVKIKTKLKEIPEGHFT